MNVKWTEHIVKDFEELDKETQKAVVNAVEKLEKEGLKIEEVDKASRKDMNVEVWRLKLKNDDIDHRIIFDIIEDQIILIAVGHRDQIYETESWDRISQRLKQV